MNSWKDTQIWQKLTKLKGEEADEVRSFLSSKDCLMKIEKILNKGATSPKDFTLHDADHSFRVAERMWEIIPINTRKILSEYELALLILSAYLHDIGMTPEYKMVKNHFQCLNSNDKKNLTKIEKNDFQRWLDEEGEQIDIEKDIIADYEKAAELVTFYCRYRHNDWSEQWIRTNFKDKELGKYTNWLNDLVNICKSHHYGLEELKTEKYNPFRMHGKVIHRRYIAMCLRLADVIEIDPERAPEVLIKHRDIIKGSISHWLKEKFTSIDIINNYISITAYPTEAFIHKAIIDIVSLIEQETNLCNTLIGEIPLENISPSNDLKHAWNILPSVHKEIKEAGNYEFIDGTFRPNSKKLLQLLAGTELYGNPLLAIRELIQNSIDAIKVQLGYRVIDDQLCESKQIESLKTKFAAVLTIYRKEDEYWIRCKDNGVGMDKDIIKKCFLISGASKRHEVLDLERRCKAIGYNLELTGQFGIGVMSYFMIADKVIVKTRKSNLSSHHEQNGWEFEINGLSDFGELRKREDIEYGTEINLRIKKEFIKNFEDSNELLLLLKESLIRLPCNFTFNSLNKTELEFKPGWTRDCDYFKSEIISLFDRYTSPKIETAKDFISEETQLKIETSQKRKLEIEKEFKNSIKFITCEGKLQNNNGFYRVHIPFYENRKGNSFAFLFEEDGNAEMILQKINNGYLFISNENRPEVSWKGIKIDDFHYENSGKEYSNCFIEIDLINEKSFQISVSRLEIMFINEFELLIEEIIKRIDEELISNKEIFKDSIYSLLNKTIASSMYIDEKYQYWTYDLGYSLDKIKFKKIEFPVIFNMSTEISNAGAEYYNNNSFNRLRTIRACSNDYESFSVSPLQFKFDIAVFHSYRNFRISFLRLNPFNGKNDFHFIGNSAKFPPEWDNLLCFRGYDKSEMVLNENNVFTKEINKEDWNWVKFFFENKIPIESEKGEFILKSRSRCISFILYLISLNEGGYWKGIIRNNSTFVRLLWKMIFKSQDGVICFFHDGINKINLIKISINNWDEIDKYEEIIKFLPIPSIEWRIDKK